MGVIKCTVTVIMDLTFGRNANGQLTGVTDNASTGRGATFGYTDSGRLNAATGPWGTDAYTYDGAGNRAGNARTVASVTTSQTPVLSATSNRVNTVQDGLAATIRTLTYRTGGDLSQDAKTAGSTYAYQYNARKRLVVAKKDGVDAGYYGYDYQGRRVWRTAFGTSTVQSHYIFDADGHLLAEHNGATGAVVREYVWLDDTPIAMIDKSSGTAVTYFIHAGQIEEPLVMTNSAKAKVWDAYVEPYGKATVFGTPSAGLDLRLPGQWTEAETGGLSQNWFRNYDPILGRYAQVDPIGISAGQNIYNYVDGRPTEFIDPNGLAIVYVNFNPVPETANIASHAYILITDNDGGNATYCRAGPSRGIFGSIKAVCGDYNSKVEDYRDYPKKSVILICDDKPSSFYRTKAVDYTNIVFTSTIPYKPWGPNSNSFAHSLVTAIGATLTNPPTFAPGWNTTISAPRN